MIDNIPKRPGFYGRAGHFRIVFTNGWAIIVYFRPGGYCENYDLHLEGMNSYECPDAEVRVESPDGNPKTAWDFLLSIKDSNWVYDHGRGAGIVGYVTPEEVEEIVAAVASIKEEA